MSEQAYSEITLPPGRPISRRLGTLPGFSHYHRLVYVVLVINVIALVMGVRRYGDDPMGVQALQALSNLVLANLSLATLIRQQYVINLLFWIATRAPLHWPLAIRKELAKVYHFGGLHSGAAMAAVFWFSVFSISLSVNWHMGASHVSDSLVGVTWVLMGVLFSVALMAHPAIRSRFHNGFERVHRFGGWTALILFWVQWGVTAEGVRQTENPGAALVTDASFWMLSILTLSVVLPWLRLRKVAVSLERPSSHVVIARFDYGETPFTGSATAISRSPLMEWHSFANIPTPGHKGYRLIISRAGDWTGRLIEELPSHVWVKGITTAGVAHIETLFHSVVYVATGSGIGPVLPHLLAANVPLRLIWSTRSPRQTYGDELVDEILRAQPNTLIWDTDVQGKPDLIRLAYGVTQAFGAEAVICIANRTLTEQVVEAMESRGIPAYGAIWDS